MNDMKRMRLGFPNSIERQTTTRVEVLDLGQIKFVNEGVPHNFNVIELESGALLTCSDHTANAITQAIAEGNTPVTLDGDPIVSINPRNRHIEGKPSNHYERWLPQHDKALLSMFNADRDPEYIATVLGRTVDAIVARLQYHDEIINLAGKVYKKKQAFWFDNRSTTSEFPGVREVYARRSEVDKYLKEPYMTLSVGRVNLTIQMLERVKLRGGIFRIGLWQNDHPLQPDHCKFRLEDELIRYGVGADLGGWLAVSEEFREEGGVGAEAGQPIWRLGLGENAVASWLGVPVEIALALLGGTLPGYYDVIYAKPLDKVTIDDTLAALYRLRDTGNPGIPDGEGS